MDVRLLVDCPDAVPTVSGWLFEQFGYLDPSATRERAEIRVRTRLNATGLPVAFVALQGETPIGTASLVETDLEECPELSPWLAGVFVLSQHRGLGYGAQIINAVVDHSRRNGFKTIYLFTPNKQVFFEKLGWLQSHRVLRRGVPLSVMERAP